MWVQVARTVDTGPLSPVTRVAPPQSSTAPLTTSVQVGRRGRRPSGTVPAPARPRSAHRDTPSSPHTLHRLVHRLWEIRVRSAAGRLETAAAGPAAAGTGSVPAQRRPARVPRRPESEEIPWLRATTATA